MDFATNDAPGKTLRFLLLEDSALDAELIADALQGTGLTYALDRVVARDEFVRAIDCTAYDLILADYVLPSFDGMSALLKAHERCPDTPFVFVSGTLGEDIAVEALKRGATDYVTKQRLERLPGTVLRALAEARERIERRRAEAEIRELLDEKTTLLHELDHRVKNNLQLQLSLLNYEIRRSGAPETRVALGRVKQRLQALGAVHRKLYGGGDDVHTFNAAEFAQDLAEDLQATARRSDIRLQFDLEPVPVAARKAAPVALLLNEILSDALMHAYQGRRGHLRLAVRREGDGCCVQVSDDAFSPAEKEAARTSSSGAIVKALAQQLDAVVEWPEEKEVLVRITLPTQ